jgi:hypothetical protein
MRTKYNKERMLMTDFDYMSYTLEQVSLILY